jgi:hypothetical protein
MREAPFTIAAGMVKESFYPPISRLRKNSARVYYLVLSFYLFSDLSRHGQLGWMLGMDSW